MPASHPGCYMPSKNPTMFFEFPLHLSLMFGFCFERHVHTLWRMLHTRVRMIELRLFRLYVCLVVKLKLYVGDVPTYVLCHSVNATCLSDVHFVETNVKRSL